jgi:ATP-dependent helicase/nuclease subunit B
MDKCSMLPPSRDLIGEVAALLTAVRNDYSENLVVFPGKRPAHFLRKFIAGEIRSAYLPPAIFSMEEFIDHMYETMSQPSRRKIETIDAIAFLFNAHRGMERPVGGDGFLSLDTFFPLGMRIFRDLEELVIEGVERSKLVSLESLMAAPLPPETARSLQSLSFFYDTFYPAIRQAGFSSRSERYRFVSSQISRNASPWRRVVFAGFYGLTASEKQLFKKILDWDDAFLLFQDGPGIRAHLSFLGINPGVQRSDDDDGTGSRAAVHFHKSPDSHGQVFALSALLKTQAEEASRTVLGQSSNSCTRGTMPVDTVAIVLPSPQSLFAVLYHALPVVPDGDFNISLGYPLERTPTWGFLSSLMQLGISMDGERFYIPDYLDVVLHPYTKNIYLGGKSEITRIMFHAVEEVLLQDRTKSFVTLGEIEENSELFTLLMGRVSRTETTRQEAEIREHLRVIHDELIRKLAIFDDIGDFADKIMAVLAFMYGHSSAHLHPFFHPFAESFMEQLDLLRKSQVKRLAFSDKHGYFHFLRRYISHCFTAFEGTPLHGLQVLGFLETRNLRFDRTYILDVNEDVIPDTRKEESLVPLGVRQAIGLPTYRDRDALAAYYFDTLVRGSREVHIFFVENGRKEKSRFVERLLWDRQAEEKTESAAPYVGSLNYRLSLETSEPRILTKTAAMSEFLRSRAFDATSLDVYLRCPLQFYYRYVLNLEKKEGTWSGVEKVGVGRLVHKIMFAYFEKRRGFTLSAADMNGADMKSHVESVFEEIYGPEPIGPVYLLRRQVLRQMEAYLQRYERPLVSRLPVTILRLEHRIERSVKGLTFRGILDRIDLRGETTCVVDYKIASSATRYAIDFDRLVVDDRDTWAEAIGSIQLPFYLFLNEEHGRARPEDGDAMFLFLGKAHLDQRIELRLFREGDDRSSAYGKVKHVLLGLASEIADPRTPFEPALRKAKACAFCDYQYLCGTQ